MVLVSVDGGVGVVEVEVVLMVMRNRKGMLYVVVEEI